VLHHLLALVLILDLSKQSKACLSDRPLFRQDSRYKSSTNVLLAIAKDMLQEQGDVVHSLHLMGFNLSHAETVGASVTRTGARNLSTDFSEESRILGLASNQAEHAVSTYVSKAVARSEMRLPSENMATDVDLQHPTTTALEESEAFIHSAMKEYQLKRDALTFQILENCKLAGTLRGSLFQASRSKSNSNIQIEIDGAALVLKMACRAKLVRNGINRAPSRRSMPSEERGYGTSVVPLGLALAACTSIVQNHAGSTLVSAGAVGNSILAGLGAALHNAAPVGMSLSGESRARGDTPETVRISQSPEPVQVGSPTWPGPGDGQTPLSANSPERRPTSKHSAASSSETLSESVPGGPLLATDDPRQQAECSAARSDVSSPPLVTRTPSETCGPTFLRGTSLRRVLTELRSCGPSQSQEEVILQCLRFLLYICKDKDGPREILAVEHSLDVITSTMLAHSDSARLLAMSFRLLDSLARDPVFPHIMHCAEQSRARLEWLLVSAQERGNHLSVVSARARRTDTLFDELRLHAQ
jgi:hypothetical protein